MPVNEKQFSKESQDNFVSKYNKIFVYPVSPLPHYVIVTMLSTFLSADYVGAIRSYNRKQQQHKEVQCPNVIQQYKCMGAVDFIYSYIGRNYILMSKKWYFRTF